LPSYRLRCDHSTTPAAAAPSRDKKEWKERRGKEGGGIELERARARWVRGEACQ